MKDKPKNNSLSEKKYKLDELHSQVTNENIHPETNFCKPVGKEIQ
jgi:hypothetical protein